MEMHSQVTGDGVSDFESRVEPVQVNLLQMVPV